MASFFLVNHNFIGSCEPRFFELIRCDPNFYYVFLLIGLLSIRNKQGLPVKGNSFDPTALAFSGTRFSSAFYGRKERRIRCPTRLCWDILILNVSKSRNFLTMRVQISP